MTPELTKRQREVRKLSKPLNTLLGKINRGVGSAPGVRPLNYFLDLNGQEQQLVKAELNRSNPLFLANGRDGDLCLTDAGRMALAKEVRP